MRQWVVALSFGINLWLLGVAQSLALAGAIPPVPSTCELALLGEQQTFFRERLAEIFAVAPKLHKLPTDYYEGFTGNAELGIPHAVGELYFKLGVLPHNPVGLSDRIWPRLDSKTDIHAVIAALNAHSRKVYQATYGVGAQDYQRLVFLLQTEQEGVKGPVVLYDPEMPSFRNLDGEFIAPPRGTVSQLSWLDSQIETSHFLRAASLGLSIVAGPDFLQHDIIGHFAGYLLHPELTRMYREKMGLVAAQLSRIVPVHWVRSSPAHQRATTLDEFNFFVISSEVDRVSRQIGSFSLPSDIKNTERWNRFLTNAREAKKFSDHELIEFVFQLKKTRTQFQVRFGGGASDGYNEGDSNGWARYDFARTPHYALASAIDAAEKLEEDYRLPTLRREAAQKLILNLSYFLAAARYQITLEELLRDAFYIDESSPAAVAAYRNSRAGQFFKDVYGDAPSHDRIRLSFVELKTSLKSP